MSHPHQSSRTSSPGPSGSPAEVGHRVLDNGLRVVSVHLPQLHSCLLSIFVRCGSRHESPRTNGISHLLEHLFFRGSARYPSARALATAIEGAGGELQGATARDHSFFQSLGHPSRLEVPFEVIGDLIGHPLFRDLELEREVILEELLSDVDEHGRMVDLEDLSMSALFGEHALALPIGGTRESVAGLELDEIRAHHARAYGARNLIAVCAGPTAPATVLRLAERALGQLPPGQALSDGPPPPRVPGRQRVLLRERAASQAQVRLSFRCPAEGRTDFPSLRILRRVLGDGLCSRLQESLVEKRALAYAVGASLNSFSDCAVFSVSAICTPHKAPALVLQILRLLGELCSSDVSEQELTRARGKSRVRADFMLDSPAEVAEWWGLGELLHGPAPALEPWLRELEAVTAADVRRAACKVFRKSELAGCVVGPLRGIEHELRDLFENAPGL